MGKFRGRRYIRGHQGLGGEGNGELLLNGYRISIWGDKKVLEIDVGDIYNIVNISNATELQT